MFVELVVAVLCGDPENPMLTRIEATAGAPIDPSSRKDVQHRDLLRDAQGVGQRGQSYRCPDSQPLRAVRDLDPHQMDGRADAVAGEVVLGEPDRVVAAGFHQVDPLESAVVDAGDRRFAVRPTEELKGSEFHQRPYPNRYPLLLLSLSADVPLRRGFPVGKARDRA